jgi:peptide/nickel transport system permease protein
MLSYTIRRILSLLPVLLVVSVVVFLITYLMPGGPAASMLGLDATKEEMDALNAALGFDRPFLTQYTDWLSGVFRGDWGNSFFLNQSVLSAIRSYFGPTLSLALVAELLALLVALPIGILSAYKRGTAIDVVSVSLTLLGTAVPGFLLGMFFMLFFGVRLRWLPVAGYAPLTAGLAKHLRYLLLPALALSVVQAAYFTRMTRSSMIDKLYLNYVRTARSKGLRERSVLLVHVLKNAAPSVLEAVGQSFGSLVTGAIVTESIFNIPGLGNLIMNAISKRDIFVIQGVVLFVTFVYVLVNLIVDLLYAAVDPRIRLDRKEAAR